MTVGTLARYLVGDRRAILTLATDRWSLPVGFLLVLTGGLARNYDGAYLLKEWQVLLHGPAVSTVNALVLYSLLFFAARIRKGATPHFLPGALSFVGLFWLTAPMAWLYAIPYERFLAAVDAVRANLWTLAFVSIWRVALMTRVLSVLYSARVAPVLLLVLLFSDVVVFAGSLASPSPIVDLMGGLQHSPEELVRLNATMAAQFWSWAASPVLLIAAAVSLKLFTPAWSVPPAREVSSCGGLVFAAGCCLVWIPILARSQPEQRLRYEAETLLRAGRYSEALAAMSRHDRSEFPPIWDPPPRVRMFNQDEFLVIGKALSMAPPALWVAELFWDKSWRSIANPVGWQARAPLNDRETLISMMEDDSTYIPDRLWPALGLHAAHDPRLAPELRQRLEALIKRRTGPVDVPPTGSDPS